MTVITFVGAGSVVFTRDLLTDLAQWDSQIPMTWRLHDLDPARLAVAEGVAHRLRSELGLTVTVEKHDERSSALDGADFVVVTVMVGGIGATRADLQIPLTYGLRQTIGDTLGVGGIFRGLRSVGFYQGLVDDVRRLCPQAWVLNYTNPMAVNLGVMHALAPDMKALGLCHSVHWTMQTLCDIVGVTLADVTYLAAGVNHQSWVLDWRRDGEDLYPLLDARIAADPELRRRVRVDMYRRLGKFPTESSEHSAEYVPWYLQHRDEIERLRLHISEYVEISEANARQYKETAEALRDGSPIAFGTEAVEYAPQVIHALATGEARLIYATVPNHGLIAQLPAGAPVEVPVEVSSEGARPIEVGALPDVCAALNNRFLDVVDHTVRAGLTQDPDLVRHAALLDPNTAASLSVSQIDSLLTELSAAHAAHLPPGLAGRRYAS